LPSSTTSSWVSSPSSASNLSSSFFFAASISACSGPGINGTMKQSASAGCRLALIKPIHEMGPQMQTYRHQDWWIR
jgi:hypothetical protein